MKNFDETEQTLRAIAETTGDELESVAGVMRDVHYVIDSFVTSDFNVLLGPLYFIRKDNPVVPAMIKHFTDDDWHALDGLKTAPPEELASALHLSIEDVCDHPCVFGSHILGALYDERGVSAEDFEEFQRLDNIVWAWRHHMDDNGVTYQVSRAGRERVFQDWLIKHLDVLSRIDVHVDLVAVERRLDRGRRIADMVCRLTRPIGELRRGDLLVIENKATPVGVEALTQVQEYQDLVLAEMTTKGTGVGAMLIADGTTVELQKALIETGTIRCSLAELGYRQHLYRSGSFTTELDIVDGTDASILEPVDAHLPDSDRP